MKQWQAVVRAQFAGGGQSWNGSAYQQNTMQMPVRTTVQADNYFAAKAQLEGQYGAGSVQMLVEVTG